VDHSTHSYQDTHISYQFSGFAVLRSTDELYYRQCNVSKAGSSGRHLLYSIVAGNLQVKIYKDE